MRKLDPKKHPKLIAFLEKAQQILKTVAVICFSLVIVLCVFFYSKACADKNTAQLISASAEASTVAETASDVESGIDLTQYPSANLIDISKCLNANFTVDEDGVYTMKRNDGGARFSRNYVFPTPLPAGTYTFSCEFVEYTGSYFYWLQAQISTSNGILHFYIDRSTNVPNEVVSMTFKNPVTSIGFYAEGNDPVGTVSKFKNFMMNAGDTAYPYIPNLDNVYNNGYNAGYDVGETDGKESGYNRGLEYAQYGYFMDSKVSAIARNSLSVGSPSHSFGPYTNLGLIYGGMDFRPLSEIIDHYTYPLIENELFEFDAIDVNLDFVKPIPLSLLNLNGAGNSTAFFPRVDLVLDNGGIIKAEWEESGDLWKLVVPSIAGTYNVLGLRFYWFNIDSLPLSLYDPSNSYTSGFNKGFEEGLNTHTNEYDEGYKKGFNTGYTSGKNVGFQEGFNQTKQGGFGWLISSVQAFLETPFFGTFGIGTLLYVVLGCSLVVMVLKFFAGG